MNAGECLSLAKAATSNPNTVMCQRMYGLRGTLVDVYIVAVAVASRVVATEQSACQSAAQKIRLHMQSFAITWKSCVSWIYTWLG